MSDQTSNPFVIKIPEGATEIDLGPILRPILYMLVDKVVDHDGIIRSDTEGEPDSIDRFMDTASDRLYLRYLIQQITRPMLIGFLEQNGWVPEDERKARFMRPYDAGKYSWDRMGPYIYSAFPENYSLHYAREAVQTLARHSLYVTEVEAAKRIIASTNLLDRIAHELGSSDED